LPKHWPLPLARSDNNPRPLTTSAAPAAGNASASGAVDRQHESKPQVLDVEDGLIEQVGNMGIVERVDHATAAPLTDNER
jgi:hypothetical protein